MRSALLVTGFVFLGLGLGGVLLWQYFLHRHHLAFVPPTMAVDRVLYVTEEAWGFGPGGNETGIIVYPMPASVRKSLEQSGIAWLEALPSLGKPHDWQGRYETWNRTPIEGPKFKWRDAAACPADSRFRAIFPAGCPSIAGYMGNYGFGIPFDPEVERMVNAALREPGSFYAFGRIGILILIPARDRIVYVYNG